MYVYLKSELDSARSGWPISKPILSLSDLCDPIDVDIVSHLTSNDVACCVHSVDLNRRGSGGVAYNLPWAFFDDDDFASARELRYLDGSLVIDSSERFLVPKPNYFFQHRSRQRRLARIDCNYLTLVIPRNIHDASRILRVQFEEAGFEFV